MTQTGTKRLIVMRHAKTENAAADDHARRLTQRGERDAVAAGTWLTRQHAVPEVVLVSSATRARATVDRLMDGLDAKPDVQVLDELYGATAHDVVELCGRIPARVKCAAVVGHNPTMAMVAQLLLGDDGRLTHFPTAAIAVIEVSAGWDVVEEASGSLLLTHTPHDD